VGVRNLIIQCRTMLELVHELHLCGYQRLRAVPEMEPSGKYWRCAIAPVSLVSKDHGARLVVGIRNDPRIVTYSSRDQNRYFGWADVYPYARAKELAMYFVDRFPEVAKAGEGSDWPYAGWYMEMLRLTNPDQFPYTAAGVANVPDTHLPTASPSSDRGRATVRIPLPPPGEATRNRELVPRRRDLLYPSSHRVSRHSPRRRLAG
jgi:hypothetical protein